MKQKSSSLDHLLAGLNRDQLYALLLKLTEHEPSLMTVIKGQVALLHLDTSPSHSLIDPTAIRRQVRSSIRRLERMSSSQAYWQSSSIIGKYPRNC